MPGPAAPLLAGLAKPALGLLAYLLFSKTLDVTGVTAATDPELKLRGKALELEKKKGRAKRSAVATVRGRERSAQAAESAGLQDMPDPRIMASIMMLLGGGDEGLGGLLGEGASAEGEATSGALHSPDATLRSSAVGETDGQEDIARMALEALQKSEPSTGVALRRLIE
ncbi:MAG: hypothetical protein V3S37_03110 [Dehalococcoidia bacterium]